MRHSRWVIVGALFMAGWSSTLFAQSVTNPRIVTVSVDGTGAQFSNLEAAVAFITNPALNPPPSSTNRYTILVYPGVYSGPSNGGGLLWPSYVSLRGVVRDTTIIRGSRAEFGNLPMLDINNEIGVEISNITFDGTDQFAIGGYYWDGSLAVCGAQVTIENVKYINGVNSGAVGASLSCDPLVFVCPSPGNIVVLNSDIAPVYDLGNNWTIAGSYLHATSAGPPGAEPAILYAYLHGQSFDCPGTVSISGSVLEAVTRAGDSVSDNYPLYIAGATKGFYVSGSIIRARSEALSSTSDTAAVYVIDAFGGAPQSGAVEIEGSTILYESPADATSGEFYGIFTEPIYSSNLFPSVHVRGSTIRSIGSGGTRADVRNDFNIDGPLITLAATEFSSIIGVRATQVTTADLRLGNFSRDLTIPLAPPVTVPLTNGRIWVDPATNQFCYRSNGQNRCVLGTSPTFMKVSRVGTSSAPGNLVCKNAGGNKRGEATVTILNRDTGAAISGAVVTGNWTGATTQTGVTATTNASGDAVFTSNTAPPGSVFTFTVTNVTHAPDVYDSASNAETSDSTPVCN